MTSPAPSAWNPGLRSILPQEFEHLHTIYRDTNSFTSLAEAMELAGMTGLHPEEIVVFRPKRLALHELMIRVMTELSIDQGDRYEDLGINFRDVVRTIQDGYITPHQDEIDAYYAQLRGDVQDIITRSLDEWLAPAKPADPVKRGFLSGLFNMKAAPVSVSTESTLERDLRIINVCDQQFKDMPGLLNHGTFLMLEHVLKKVVGSGQSISATRALITKVATGMACNLIAGEQIAYMMTPWLNQAIAEHGYRRLPVQDDVVIMSVKGASASGKSTRRPDMKILSGKLGLDWGDFALISPDICRKFLLDYGTLGEAHLYAGTLTGYELGIIDHKLDSRLANIAEFRGKTSHMMIDRFRDDTFATYNTSAPYVSRAQTMYMFFMVTAPEEIVERGWKRGQQVGRYKSVEDFLVHSVEAYEGMQQLLFKWMMADKPDYHFELVDNSGHGPVTSAFGHRDEMSVFDPKILVDVVRFSKINVTAQTPETLYPAGEAMDTAKNMGFWNKCLDRMHMIQFIDHASQTVYARYQEGALHILDDGVFAAKLAEGENGAIFSHIAARTPKVPVHDHPAVVPHLQPGEAYVLGAK